MTPLDIIDRSSPRQAFSLGAFAMLFAVAIAGHLLIREAERKLSNEHDAQYRRMRPHLITSPDCGCGKHVTTSHDGITPP